MLSTEYSDRSDSDFQITIPKKGKGKVGSTTVAKKIVIRKGKTNSGAVDKAAISEEQKELLLQQQMSQKLIDKACNLGMFSKSVSLKEQTNPYMTNRSITKLMLSSNCNDIIKRSTNQSVTKYVHVLPGRMQQIFVSAGTGTTDGIGILKGLDTLTPTLYIDFPTGRLKFFGAIVMTENNFLVAQFTKSSINVGDAVDSLIVYSECCWIGTEEENPQEKPLPVPQQILKVINTATGKSAFDTDDEDSAAVEEKSRVGIDASSGPFASPDITGSSMGLANRAESGAVSRPRRHVAEVSYLDSDEKLDKEQDDSDSEEFDSTIRPNKYIIGKKSPLKPEVQVSSNPRRVKRALPMAELSDSDGDTPVSHLSQKRCKETDPQTQTQTRRNEVEKYFQMAVEVATDDPRDNSSDSSDPFAFDINDTSATIVSPFKKSPFKQ
eukprot:CFRG4883T1